MSERMVQMVTAALHDQFFCGCEWGYEAEHHPGDRDEWEKAARIAVMTVHAVVEGAL